MEETSEPQLRNNRLVDELLKHYLILRATLQKCLRLEESEVEVVVGKMELSNYDQTLSHRVEKNDKELLEDSDVVCEESSRMLLASASLPSPGITVPGTTTPVSMTDSSTCEKNRVACPVCNVPVPTNSINFHLDKCLLWEEKNILKKS
ncbi:E3 ubiquitin-protein ligase RAD18-like [Tachypleus tridentatus]|uniref:E3 ubiquitin-protein ligase RAD18-like n=1 Tax=Tachypleus tridentatus TaxID=6853 RepID=UPI003FD255C1